MTFKNEAEFENKLIGVLTKHGWESDIIKYPTENDLLEKENEQYRAFLKEYHAEETFKNWKKEH